MVVIAGCQDNVVSAPQSSSAVPVSMMMAPSGSPRLSLVGSANADVDVDFTVNEKGGVFFLGNGAVVFPARSICDPAKSSYGPGTWDSPCTALKGSLKIHATIRTAKLGTWIDFSPALRFVPSDDSRDWVYLYMSAPNSFGAKDLSKYAILYAPTLGAKGIDESLTNASLRTYVDSWRGVTMRRIQHFSGYIGSSGRACDPATETDCYPVGR
jgi:hypothetical protein